MTVDSNIKFARALKGYAPQEVDAAFDEMQKQIENLQQQQTTLSDAITRYNEKVRQFEAGAKRLEDERCKESLRATGVLDKAVWAAGETEQEASQKAADIIRKAQLEAESINSRNWKNSEEAWGMLSNISQNLQSVVRLNQQFYTHVESMLNDLEVLLQEALNEISLSSPSLQTQAAPEVAVTVPGSAAPMVAPAQVVTPDPNMAPAYAAQPVVSASAPAPAVAPMPAAPPAAPPVPAVAPEPTAAPTYAPQTYVQSPPIQQPAATPTLADLQASAIQPAAPAQVAPSLESVAVPPVFNPESIIAPVPDLQRITWQI